MLHLTYTGQYAGLTLCGAPRALPYATPTDRYVHAMYAPSYVLSNRDGDTCLDCIAVWNSPEDSSDN